MEDWQLDFEWLKVRHYIMDTMKHEKLPDFQAVLFLIGVQELGRIPQEKFTKEEKQDLMHVAVCTLLEGEYYEFEGRDQDGWPHFKPLKKFELKGVEEQERFLKSKIVTYLEL